jgi:hypothetical protein
LFFDRWFRDFGLPEKLISDRDTKFTSDFWRALHKLVGTRLNMSTANHPETDGRSERTNRTLEDILRAYVSPFHNDWDDRLAIAEFAINDSVHASTGVTPFFASTGFHPRVPLAFISQPVHKVGPENLKVFTRRRREEVKQIQEAMRKAQERQAFYANQHRREVEFKVGDRAWLATTHLRLPEAANATRKLQPRFHGPYKVTQVISPVAYRLDLPPGLEPSLDWLSPGVWPVERLGTPRGVRAQNAACAFSRRSAATSTGVHERMCVPLLGTLMR